MTECKASAAFYDHLDSLVKQEDYQTALDLCNSRKQEGAFDSTLFTYYDYCYMGLENTKNSQIISWKSLRTTLLMSIP